MQFRARSKPHTKMVRKAYSQARAQVAVADMLARCGQSVRIRTTNRCNKDGIPYFRAGSSKVGSNHVAGP